MKTPEKKTENLIYKIVKENHINLTQDNRRYLISQLSNNISNFEKEIFKCNAVRRFIYDMFNFRLKNNKSLAYISKQYNKSYKDYNKIIANKVKKYITLAFNVEKEGNKIKARDYLLKANIRYSILLMPEIEELLERNKFDYAIEILKQIKIIHEKLLNSVLKMISEIAHKESKSLSGDIITYEDLFSEGVLAAQEGIYNFQPDTDTFPNYMYELIKNVISKYVAEKSRTIALPRSIIDRAIPVIQAKDKLGNEDLKDITSLANKINYDKKQKSRKRKLNKEELYTEEEVYNLLKYIQDTASLDAEIEQDELGHSATLKDIIEINSYTQEEVYDKVHNSDILLNVISSYCKDPEEFEIMVYKWGLVNGEILGLEATVEVYKNKTGNSMNKGKVAEIEKRIFNKLRLGAKNGDERLIKVMQSFSGMSNK